MEFAKRIENHVTKTKGTQKRPEHLVWRISDHSNQGSGQIHLAGISDSLRSDTLFDYKYICIAMKDCIAKEEP